MAFRDFPATEQGIALLQRSLERGRLGHGYLFAGQKLEYLEAVAGNLAKTLNCHAPVRSEAGVPLDCCDQCESCRKIDGRVHPDVQWVRPESKLRIISIAQVRDLSQVVNLKPTEAQYKVGIIVGADRLNVQAANAFLKTLEEPPAKSVLILLTTDASRVLETLLSRCLRLTFSAEGRQTLTAEQREWLLNFTSLAGEPHKSLLGRYRLMDVLLQQLARIREKIEKSLSAQSPLEKYEEIEKNLRDKWEDELSAAIEADYRRQRADLLGLLQLWLRDVWMQSVSAAETSSTSTKNLLHFPEIQATAAVAARITPQDAAENLAVLERLQRLLSGNVQEALALEVSLLKLRL